METQAQRRTAAAVFVLSALVLWLLCANRLSLNVDEGIYLDGALRVLHGDAPYRDFFVHTGPGAYWLYAAAFRVFGVSLSHARLVLILELAAVTASVHYLCSQLTARRFAISATAIFFLFEMRDLNMVALNHRWDSSALAFIALTPTFAALRQGSQRLAFVGGAVAAAGAWVTPPLGLVGFFAVAWIFMQRGQRRLAIGYVGGVASVTAACLLLLSAEGALQSMLHHFLWTGENYSAANRVPYGWMGSGWAEIGKGLDGPALVIYAVILAWLVLPAALPPLTWLAWSAWLSTHRDFPLLREMGFLLVCSVALVVSAYPRWDLGHLLYVAPVFYVLAAAFVYHAMPHRAKPLMFVLSLAAAFLWLQPLIELSEWQTLETPAGPVRMLPADRALVETFLHKVRPGEGLFVFPYQATVYFLTLGKNPTRFSYLQPGLMTDEDELTALGELQANPPRWVWYSDVPPELYLKHWPSSDPSRLRMRRIEAFFKDHYREANTAQHSLGKFALLERVN